MLQNSYSIVGYKIFFESYTPGPQMMGEMGEAQGWGGKERVEGKRKRIGWLVIGFLTAHQHKKAISARHTVKT